MSLRRLQRAFRLSFRQLEAEQSSSYKQQDPQIRGVWGAGYSQAVHNSSGITASNRSWLSSTAVQDHARSALFARLLSTDSDNGHREGQIGDKLRTNALNEASQLGDGQLPVEDLSQEALKEAGEAASEVIEATAHASERDKVLQEQTVAPGSPGNGSAIKRRKKDHVHEEEGSDGRQITPDDWESIVSNKWVTDEIEDIDIGSYLGLPRQFLPEVFFEELPSWEELHPRGGCRGLEVSSKTDKKIYLVGPGSSGKSVALATIVAQMRASGWLVMYIPEAKQLTSGGFFNRHPELPHWDTPEVAKLILYYLVQGNPQRAEEEKSGSSGKSLLELAQMAIESNDPHLTVDLFLEIKEILAAASNSLIAIDNYQALYSPTDYGEWLSPKKRRAIEASELRVASALRVLEDPPLRDGVVLCAAQRSGSFSHKMRLPLEDEAKTMTIPRLDFEEWTAMADFYKMTGAIETLSDYSVKKAYYTMAGNPLELRKYAPLLAADEEDEEVAESSGQQSQTIIAQQN